MEDAADAGEPEQVRPKREVRRHMLWAVATALGLVGMTGLVFVLARPVTARWEEEQRPPVTVDE